MAALTLLLCPNSEPNPFAFDDPCIRASWSAALPVVLVSILSIAATPVVKQCKSSLFKPFQEFLTLEEAEALSSGVPAPADIISPTLGPKRTSAVLVSLALAEIILWIVVGILEVTFSTFGVGKLPPFLLALSWLYAFLRPLITNPIVTAQMDLFWLFSLEFSGAVLLLGGALFDYGTLTVKTGIVLVVNVVLNMLLLAVVLDLPFAIPVKQPLQGELELAPEDYTRLWSWITFAWVYPLIRRGTNNTLAEADVWNLSTTMQARPVFWKFMYNRRATLLRSILAANSSDLILDAALSIVSVLLSFSGPFFLNLILAKLEHREEGGLHLASLYVFLAFAGQMAKSEADLIHFYYGRRASTRIRTELMIAVYDKALKRRDFSGVVDSEAKADANAVKDGETVKKDGNTTSAGGKEEEENLGPKSGATLGKIANLMSVDATAVCSVPFQLFWLYSAPFEIGFSVLFLYNLLGLAAFSGVFFVLIFIPLNWTVAKLTVKYEKGIVTARDKRTSVVNELISSIKFIKFGGAEEKWLRKANDSRDVELKWLLKSKLMGLAFQVTWTLLPLLISVSSFYVYVKQGNDLSVSTAFTALAVFNMLSTPLSAVPMTISSILQGGVALSRIAKFLEEDEVTEEVSTLKKSTSRDDTTSGLFIKNGSFKWNELDSKNVKPQPSVLKPLDEESRFKLRNISVSFPEGELTCVVGPTASGKTALLLALLGEMTPLAGTLINPPKSSRVDENGLMGCISYAAQNSWLQHNSIRDNIIFGSPFDEERYQSVLDACALRQDFEILPDGDLTEIGVRGVSLSGGQKARVALARAVYAWTKYVLLDDPLSAVDSHTARVLFDKLFCGPILKNRTVVLVTHHVDLLLSASGQGASYIVRMVDGRIDTQGAVRDLRARGLLDTITRELPRETTTAEDFSTTTEVKPASAATTKLVEDEEQAKGDVQWRIYKTYLQATSYKVWVLVVMLVFSVELTELGQKLWIKVWGEAYQTISGSDFLAFILAQTSETAKIQSVSSHMSGALPFEFPAAHDQPMFYVGIYAVIGLGTNLANVSLVAAHFYGSLRASRLLFRNLLKKLVYSTFRWFDATPKGRILNRIGKDISTVDTTLSQSLANLTNSLAALTVAVLTIGVVFPYFIVPGALLSFTYYKISIGYLHVSRDLRRMEANTRSPIFTGFSELLEGIVTVRAFGDEKRFLDDMYNKVDITTRLYYNFWQANRWLLLYFDYLGATSVFLTSLLAVSSFVPAGLAGICITSAMSFSRTSYFACRFYTDLQVDLNAVERVVNYLEIPQEPPAVIESNRPPAYWPSSAGTTDLLVVEDLEVKYAPDLPPVLHHISFSLKRRERVGLLGRTGSGKSTLATSLLRFVEPSSGRILVDGIDISHIGLHDLRTRLTLISQDVALHSGTVRENLDPFDEYEDAECQDALYRVHLLSRSAHQSRRTSERASPVAELEGETPTISGVSSITESDAKPTITLDTLVSAEGQNFSAGQRQLIALARALLRQSSIVILDEATSSIDFETDKKIQTTIREQFNDSLVLTVAHRIRTVIDCDRLIILSEGKIAEFDTPYNLIHKTDGIFHDMCKKSGAFEELEAAAKESK
ncbi:hypothetical protein FB451DRAFT_27658 [Mycena latifolia]|nr:hypothetical protein FB451DRAFT_27658 [Mycena latifolia]